ncbi:MAG: hypothetical protein RIA62_16660 [Cyclobacteriaceae bacterium]
MGRQLQICTTELDNRNFTEYLRANFKCKIYQSFAPTKEKLQIQEFDKTFYPFNRIYIWNTDFHWELEFAQDRTEKKNFYISNKFYAPIIEFSKSHPKNGNGRIYWGKQNSEGFYDTESFEQFYNSIRKWFLNNSAGKIKQSGTNTYFLEDAWNKRTNSV